MSNYKIDSRRKIEDFLRSVKRPVVQSEIQKLGSATWHLRHDTVCAVLRDLSDESKVLVTTSYYGRMTVVTYEWIFYPKEVGR
jgi:hypothetical protein